MSDEKRIEAGNSPSASSINIDEYQLSARQYGSYEPHVFSDPVRRQHWQDIYETARYEGRHRFDPELTWSPQSERLLKRKVALDMRKATQRWFVII
jgi:hypothetical protein